MKSSKTGIMGGTFDPPHIGHLIAAAAAADTLGLEKIIFVPTGKISYKDSSKTAAPACRYDMTKLAIEDNPLFDISDIETGCADYSYTFNTIKKFKEKMPYTKLFFIVGADSLDYIDSWREPEQIFSCCSIAAVNREGVSTEALERKAADLRCKFGAEVFVVTIPNIGVSSSDIRRRIKENKTVDYLIRDTVLEYIKENKLYIG